MKLPPEAKKVFNGVLFDVYQWEQKMFDGTEEIFEMLKRVNTVEVIAVKGDKICVSHQSQPTKPNFISLLGGRGHEGEDPLVTAKRELLEESGLASENWELWKEHQPLHKIDWTIYTYIARNCQKVAEQSLDSGEQIEVKEYTFDEFINVVLSEKFWGGGITSDILRMKVDGTLEEFRKRLFSVLSLK